ncbi:MAG: sigma factor-like helix-turn-helix DNA-binding protein [Acidimicrobiia bacterium]
MMTSPRRRPEFDEAPPAHLVRSRTFEDFYRGERDALVRALTLTLRDVSLGTDAADEAMARAYQRWDRVGAYDNPMGWTYRVGLNWARSRIRKLTREVSAEGVEPVVVDPSPLDPAVARAIDDLSTRHRAVVVLRYFLDWSIDDIARGLELRPGTVKSRLHRSLRALRTELEVQE